jgi:hypothetical protein
VQTSSLTLKVKARLHVGCAFALATLFAAMCGGAGAQTITKAEVNVVPTSAPQPKGVCTTKGSFRICVDPEPVPTSGPIGGNVEIIWDLKGSGWTFVKNKGIDIKNMKNWKIKGTPTQYSATNKKERNVLYKYDINVTDGTTTLQWDPMIMN